MATLTNTRIKNTYDGLLKTTDNDALGGTYKLITDGLGNSSNIYLGTGGNLGIGIIPTEKFHVNGDAIVSGDLHVDAIKPIASSNPIKFKNFASTELVRITDSGNVGIGETDPSKPLTINKNQSETAILVQSSDTGLSGIYLGGQSDSIKGGLILDNTDNSIQLRGYNNANRLFVRSNGNIGIGTTDVGAKLVIAQPQIVSGGFSTPFIELKSTAQTNNTGLVAMSFSTSTADNYGYSIGALRGSSGGASAFVISHHDNSLTGTERMRIDSSGNVGIGTTDPQSKLQVEHSDFARLDLNLSNSSGTTIADVRGLVSGTEKWRIGKTGSSSDDFTINVTGSERMRIDSSGNVGIGTSSPNTALEVDGAITTTTSDYVQGSIGSRLILETSGSGNTNSYIQAQSGGGTSSAEDLALQLYGGNVGIGVANPSSFFNQARNLVVGGSANVGATIYSSSSGNTFLAFADVADGANSGFNAGGSIYYEHANDAMVTRVNGSERMRIDSSGVVQVRNQIPTIQLFNTDTSLGSQQTLGDLDWYQSDASGSGANVVGKIRGVNESNFQGQGALTFHTGISGGSGEFGVVERMRIDSSGKVGIGTTDPAELLTVSASDDVSIRINSTKNGTWTTNQKLGALEFFGNDSSSVGAGLKGYINLTSVNTFGAAFDMNFGVGSNATDRMVIKYNGNIGIGTTNPSEKLEVIGNAILDNNNAKIKIKAGAVDTVGSIDFTFNTDSTQYGLIDLNYNSRASQGFRIKSLYPITLDAVTTQKFLINGSERMRINSSGNVGIGLTNPSAGLHVNASGKGATIKSSQSIGLEVQGGGNNTDIAIFKDTSGNEEFSISNSGALFSLGMANSSSANASLMHNSSTGQIYRYTSSIRYKEDVKDLTNAVDKIMKLRPVEFKPKDSLKYTTGMIAEEVFEVMPEITFEAKIEGFDEPQVDGISYEPMHAYYIKAIQELKSEIETLKSQINS